MAEEDIKLPKKQKGHKEIGIIYFIIALFLIGVIFIFAMQFFAPTSVNNFYKGECTSIVISNQDYETIQDLIDGKNVDTSHLKWLYADCYCNPDFISLAQCCETQYCDHDECMNFYSLITKAHQLAIKENTTARSYFQQANEILVDNPSCLEN